MATLNTETKRERTKNVRQHNEDRLLHVISLKIPDFAEDAEDESAEYESEVNTNKKQNKTKSDERRKTIKTTNQNAVR